MKIEEIKERNKAFVPGARYRVTLSTELGGHLLAFQTRLNAGSPQEAQDQVARLFKKMRGEIQEAVLRNWEVREITPLVKHK